jgi:acyl-CoA synthetase (AMP-forming)/AMP-acid ligase II
LFGPGLFEVRPQAKVLWSHRNLAEQWYDLFIFIVLFAEQWQFGRPWKWIFPQATNWIYPFEEFLVPFHHRIGSDPSLFTNIFPWYDLLRADESPFKTDPVLKQNWIDRYNNTPRQLKESIGCSEQDECKERFLAFNVKQGWGSLLEFLNISDDDLGQQPFPQVNEHGTLVIVTKFMHALGAGLPIVAMLILYLLYGML